MATISNTPRPGYVWDVTDNVWYPIGVGGHSHGEIPATIVDAKGDLIAGTAADTVSRLAVGTNGQYLKADSTAGTGLAWATLPSSGKVLQVVSATNATAVVSSSTTFVDTNLTATITPSSATSKILVMVTQSCFKSAANASLGLKLNINRGASAIFTSIYLLYTGTAIELSTFETIGYLDSPSTTSATTYKTQFANQFNNASVEVQPSNTTSSIILMEIGA